MTNMENLAERTKEIFTYYFNYVIKNCFNNEQPDDLLKSDVVDLLISWVMNSNKTNNVKTIMLRSWLKFCKNDNLNSVNKIDKCVNRLKEQSLYQKPKDKEINDKISMDDVKKLRNEYQLKIKNNILHHYDVYYLLCSLYSYLPPLRSEDYINTLIKNDDTNIDSDNYFDYENKQLVFNHYKTKKIHGRRIIDVPNELCEIINNFHIKSNSMYLICTHTGGKLTNVTFNHLFKRCFKGSHVSSSILRKVFISESNDNNICADERIKNAKIMAHLPSTQQSIYTRYSDFLHPDDNNIKSLMRRRKSLLNQLKIIDSNILSLYKIV